MFEEPEVNPVMGQFGEQVVDLAVEQFRTEHPKGAVGQFSVGEAVDIEQGGDISQERTLNGMVWGNVGVRRPRWPIVDGLQFLLGKTARRFKGVLESWERIGSGTSIYFSTEWTETAIAKLVVDQTNVESLHELEKIADIGDEGTDAVLINRE